MTIITIANDAIIHRAPLSCMRHAVIWGEAILSGRSVQRRGENTGRDDDWRGGYAWRGLGQVLADEGLAYGPHATITCQ